MIGEKRIRDRIRSVHSVRRVLCSYFEAHLKSTCAPSSSLGYRAPSLLCIPRGGRGCFPSQAQHWLRVPSCAELIHIGSFFLSHIGSAFPLMTRNL